MRRTGCQSAPKGLPIQLGTRPGLDILAGHREYDGPIPTSRTPVTSNLPSHGDAPRLDLRPYQAPLLSDMGGIYERTACPPDEICGEIGATPIFEDSVFTGCTTPAP